MQVFLLIFINFTIPCGAQYSEDQPPKIKKLGSSLKHDKDRNKPKQSPNEDVIEIKTDLVMNEVLVFDEKGNLVKGLAKDDFTVTEDGDEQDIQVFAFGSEAKLPRSIVLLLDHSYSEIPFLVNSIMSAKILIDNLHPNDRVAIVTDNIELLCDFTHDRELLKKKLDSLKERVLSGRSGQSRQYSALTATANELFHPEDVRRIVIFQTDGDQINLKTKPFDVNDLMSALEKSRPTIYSIFPGLQYDGLSEREKYEQAKSELESIGKRFAGDRLDLSKRLPPPSGKQITTYYEALSRQQQFLTRVADSTGGWTAFLKTPVQANQIYSKILGDINNRYAIGYYPKNETKSSQRRTVKIEVKNHPEYQIEGRKTYFTPEY